MALTELLSNPVGPLKIVLEYDPLNPSEHDLLRRKTKKQAKPARDQHPRAGWVVKAIVRVLKDQEPMQAKEIHAAVEALLGKPVRWSSVKAALAANIAGPSPRFVRVAKGRYRLR